MDFLNIPEDRAGVLIGKDGETKRLIEDRLGVKLNIKGSMVEIDGNDFDVFRSKPVIKAIARGFSPEKALTLESDENELMIIDLDILFSTEKKMKVQKGRIIGREGRTREHIEKSLGVYISVYGRTISIIGGTNSASIAKEALERLLSGSPHNLVYAFIERKKREMRWQ
jgi:ribosomal RNA assembly protein